MKKIMLIITSMLLALALFGCTTNKPVITFDSKDVTVNVFEEFDFMEGVSASDKEDGDLTNDIKIDLGSFNKNVIGDYKVKYSVTNSKGKELTVTRNVSVSYINPIFSNHDDEVVSLNNLKITKGYLYETMKSKSGAIPLIELVDRELLKDFNDSINMEELRAKINIDKEELGTTEFYIKMEQSGVFMDEGETQQQLDAKIEDYYKIEFLRKVAVEDYTRNKLSESYKNDLYNNYVEDACVISLAYSTKANFENAVNEYKDLPTEDLINALTEKWKNPNINISFDMHPDYNCEYERAIYSELRNSTVKEIIFNDLEVGEFNQEPKLIDNYYYLFYKVSEAPRKETYNIDEFKGRLVDRYLTKVVNEKYIEDVMVEKRKDAGFKIFDSKLADDYTTYDENFVKSTKINENTVAMFNNKVITANELYDYLKQRIAVNSIMNKLNYEAIKTVDEIQLTQDEKNEYDDIIANIKKEYLDKGYDQYFNWSQFLNYQFGVKNNQDLKDIFILQELTRKYIFGFEKDGEQIYPGVDPILQSEIDAAYNEWFNVKASHILFSVVPNNPASKNEAYIKAMQIIQGVKEGEEPYIKLNNEDFIGLNNIDAADYNVVFSELAKAYSSDTGSGQNGGDLGYFGKGRMVTEFEEAVIDIINTTGVGGYSQEPVETKFGYHIIYVTGIEEAPQKPAAYDDYTKTEIKDLIDKNERTDEEFLAIKEYYNFIKDLEEDIYREHLTADNIYRIFALLREDLDVVINDEIILKHYQVIQKEYIQ